MREKGIAAAVEEFIFSKEFNFASEGRHPDLLGRFLGGLFHPMIHIGYGFEFSLPGLVAEGDLIAMKRASADTAFLEALHRPRFIETTLQHAFPSLSLKNTSPPVHLAIRYLNWSHR